MIDDPEISVSDATHKTDAGALIRAECKAVEELLLSKNEAYGNSALEPIGIFAGKDPERQIRVRIDDKLKRLQNMREVSEVGNSTDHMPTEDTELDLIGYLILLRVAREYGKPNRQPMSAEDARRWARVYDGHECELRESEGVGVAGNGSRHKGKAKPEVDGGESC